MSTELETALAFDPLDSAEKITGLDYKTDGLTVALGIGLMQQNSERKKALLAEAKDTNSWHQTAAEWIAAVEGMGFQLLHTEDIPESDTDKGTDKLRIFYRAGVLLVCDSYWGDTSINSANAYLNFQGPRTALSRSSNGWAGGTDETPVWDVGVDAREGLGCFLKRLEEHGQILPQWVKQPFLWLLSYRDTKGKNYEQKNYDYAALNKARLTKLPPEVRAACLA